MRKMWPAAIVDCQRALEIDPHNLKALVVWAECLINVGKTKHSAKEVQMGLAKLGEALFLCNERPKFSALAEAVRAKTEKATRILHFIERLDNLSRLHDLRLTLDALIAADTDPNQDSTTSIAHRKAAMQALVC